MTVELKSGKVFEGTLITKALNVIVFKTDSGKYLLISRYSLKDPDAFKFAE